MILRRAIPAVALVAAIAGCAPQQAVRPAPAPEPGMMVVPRGGFTMGRDGGPLNEQPAHDVELDGYFLDRTEVSAGDFAAFLNAEGNPADRYFTADEFSTIGEDPAASRERFQPRAGYAAFPANNVSWYGADAYCRWRGRRLPTEAEWEKGARGTDERRYPWGALAPDARRARFARSWAEQGLEVLAPVDALPEGASAYGQLNMAGNVLEWVRDWYRQNLCDFCNPEAEAHLQLLRQLTGQGPAAGDAPATAPAAGTAVARQRQAPPRANPTGPSTGIFKVLRGGSWQESDSEDLRTTRRFWLDPSQRFANTGFRCATDAQTLSVRPPQPASPARP